MRAADYGDILVWNYVTGRRHELTSMGIRVNDRTLRQQLEMTGGGIGQSRTLMLLRKAHLDEVSVTVWPKVLKEMCARKNIFVLD